MQIKSENLKAYSMFKKHGKDPNGFKFGEAKTAEGKLIAWEGTELMVGSEVLVETEEGFLPAPDGVHTLEDGSMIETAGGMVAAIKPAEAAAPEAPAAPAEEQAAAPETGIDPVAPNPKAVIESTVKETRFSQEEVDEMLTKEREELTQKFTAVETEKNELTAKFDAQAKEITDLKAQVSSLISLLDEKPADQPVHTNNTQNFLSAKVSDEKNRAKQILERLRNKN